MRHKQQKNTAGSFSHDSDRLPALLTVHHTFRNQNPLRVAKDLTGLPKADAVLALIGEVLGLIPLEPDSAHYNSVITN